MLFPLVLTVPLLGGLITTLPEMILNAFDTLSVITAFLAAGVSLAMIWLKIDVSSDPL